MAQQTILVVDDTADMRALTGEILRLAGFAVVEARSGEEALALATSRPDLIILDVHMPDMDGFEVCRRLKSASLTAQIPVLYLSSAYREEQHRIRGLETGGAAYLTRPLEPNDLVSTVRALLDIKRAEAQAIGSPERFRGLFEHAHDGVWTADAGGTITHANRRLASMLGYDAADLIGRAFSDFVDPEDRLAARRALERQQLGIAGLYEVRCWRKDATELWAIVSAIPLLDERGETRGTVGVVIDVTERKRMEEGLLRLASIVECSNDAIIATTLDGIILSWNPAARTMFGYTAEEAIGRSIGIVVPPERHRELAELLKAIRDGERAAHVDTVRRRKDGSTLLVDLSVAPIQDASGRVIGASTIARDVTDRQRAAQAERESAALRSVASLATAAAHEINNPLTAVLGAIEILQRRTDLPDDVPARLELARAAALEIHEIVRRMASITRLERVPQSPILPEMLDLLRSSQHEG
jgi:PAS domain S-box-containing protein